MNMRYQLQLRYQSKQCKVRANHRPMQPARRYQSTGVHRRKTLLSTDAPKFYISSPNSPSTSRQEFTIEKPSCRLVFSKYLTILSPILKLQIMAFSHQNPINLLMHIRHITTVSIGYHLISIFYNIRVHTYPCLTH